MECVKCGSPRERENYSYCKRCQREYLQAWREAQGNCRIDDCDRLVKARGMCKLHYERWFKHGDPLYVRPKKEPKPKSVRELSLTYSAVHCRHRKVLGKASEYSCQFGCGQQAECWAYDHDDPGEMVQPYGNPRDNGKPYSLDPAHYLALCWRCHNEFDGNGFGRSQSPYTNGRSA